MEISTGPKPNHNKETLETKPYSLPETPTNKPAPAHKTQWETTAILTNADNFPTDRKTDPNNA